jgi:hypothetical protein
MAETEKTTEAAYITTALAVLQLFLLGILSLCLVHCRTLFLQSHGMKHRLCGAIHLCLFSVGAWTASGTLSNQNNFLLFNFILGVSGLVTTLTAADDFPHRLVSNNRNGVYVQSGTLHETAIVTQAEMVEHSFYQALNLGQALYLHAMHRGSDSSNLPLWMAGDCPMAIQKPCTSEQFQPQLENSPRSTNRQQQDGCQIFMGTDHVQGKESTIHFLQTLHLAWDQHHCPCVS